MKKSIFTVGFNKNNHLLYRARSFVCRQRRLTKGQRYAIDNYWSMMGVEFSEKLINFVSLFGRDSPVMMEIGFGMGASLISMAEKNSEKNFFGIEVYLPGIGSCLSSAYKNNIKNLRIIYHDAVEVLYKMIPDNSLNVVQIFFPDPWQKARHNKRRIIQMPFVELIRNKLKLGGMLHVATDWEPYANHILKIMSSLEGYKNKSTENNYVPRPESRPVTKFEKRSYHFGYNVCDLMFEKIKCSKLP